MPLDPRNCVTCGAEYQPRRSNQKYCVKCSPRIKVLEPKPCLWCHKDISSLPYYAKFCEDPTCNLSFDIMERRIWGSLFTLEEKRQLIQQLKKAGKDFKFPEVKKDE